MNPKHAAALLLVAAGAFLILAGSILVAVGAAEAGGPPDPMAARVGGWSVAVGAITCTLGVTVLAVGVYVYRRSDHRMLPGDDVFGLARTRFPLLSPLMGALLILTTALLAWSVWVYGFDWASRRAVAALAGWGLLTAAFLAALVRAAAKRRRAGRTAEPTSARPLSGVKDSSEVP